MVKATITDAIEAVRSDKPDATELRQSMKDNGWDPRFPAVKDENGVVLIGHRRLAIAQELGIKPVFVTWPLGSGDDADVERVRLALISNVGGAAATAADRKHLAQHLYKTKGWTQVQIAKAVGVSQSSVRDYLRLVEPTKREPTVDTLGRKNTGRPKGSAGPKPERRKYARATEDKAASLILDTGKPRAAAAAEAGVTETVARMAVAREEGRREGQADPIVDPTTLSKSAQEKLAAALRQQQRQYQRQNEIEVDRRVSETITRLLEETILPSLKRREAEAFSVTQSRRGCMKREEYMLVLSCLHPDARLSVSPEKLSKAFQLLKKLEQLLVPEKELPTERIEIPPTFAELLAMRERMKKEKAEAAAAARAKRNGTAEEARS
jgi:hypothetical protein